jgi:glutamate/tyrosine decarboxylase-like PLP-dependent enzyme
VLENIRKLERLARRLDPGADERQALFGQAADYAEAFLEALPDTLTYTRDDGRDGFAEQPLQEEPTPLSELLAFFRREVDTTGILPASGGQLGYIPGGGLYPSALGDFLAGISNRYSGVAFAGPGAARMEWSLVQWMCRLLGYSDGAAGDLTSGGSVATLSALVTARDARGIDPSRVGSSCVYMTAQAHHCIGKALHVAGLGSVRTRTVPMDGRYRMDCDELEAQIVADREAGLNPWLVAGSAGTTDTGAILGRADSIVVDPHKGLGIPYGSGAVLVRDGELLARSNSYYADYMQDAKKPGSAEDGPYSPADFSPELTRPFRGPRLWLPLRLFGLRPFRAALAEKIWLARYFHEALGELPGFETGPYPDLSIATFRYRPRTGDPDAFNQRLLAAVHDDGKVFITSTLLDGVFTLRLAVLNFRTHLDTIDYLLDLLRRKAAELEGRS